MLRRHQGEGAERPPTPADDIQLPHNDQGEQGLDENVRNPSKEAKRQETSSKTISTTLGHWLGRKT